MTPDQIKTAPRGRMEHSEPPHTRTAMRPGRRSAPTEIPLVDADTVAAIAHDLRNLLAVVKINADELAEGLSEGEHRGLADEIRLAAERSATLARQLQTDDLGVEPGGSRSPTAINRAIDTVLPLVRRTAGKAIEVGFHPGSRLPHVTLTPDEIERVLINLAANSREAMPEGGRIDVRTALLSLELDSRLGSGWFVTLSISDDGRGMDPEVAARARESLFTTRQDDGGTGVGLTTVEALICAVGGWMRIASSPLNGTEIKIALPAVGREGQLLSTPPLR